MMRPILASLLSVTLIVALGNRALGATVDEDLKRVDLKRGIVAVIGLTTGDANHLVDLCRNSEWTLYFQTDNQQHVDQVRQAAESANLLGSRLFVQHGSPQSIHLGNNVADRILVAGDDVGRTPTEEVLRALRPRGIALIGTEQIVKQVPDGVDSWSHPYHGPDNNPNSDDQLVRGSFRTQFIGYPKFSPMPEQTVVAGGRIYKAMGHIAHKANQNEMLNTLVCINAYNGTLLWRRPLTPGFMLHRNTMIATEDSLFMGDHESCKIIDGETGELREEIKVVGADNSDGPVWKWMAMRDGVLYALVGNPEVKIETQRAVRRGLGHWPWGMWDGHDYDDPRTSFGFGRTLLAIDLKSNDRIWNYRDQEFLDARAICMNDTQIFSYCPGKFLAAIDRYTGKLMWKNSDKELLEAIADNERAQHYITGYATTAYMKCTDDYLFFAGPQRTRMVVASTKDGKLAWTHPTGNLQLVLRKDAIWAAGPQDSENGMKFDYATGQILDTFPARRACTRATGCADSIFYRANGGTVRVLTDSNTAQHIDPMRPPCQDGVIVAEGHLYWGPWMCGCQLSLYGNIGLRPGDDLKQRAVETSQRLITGDLSAAVAPLQVDPRDWSVYRGGNSRDDVSQVAIPGNVSLAWSAQICNDVLPTAPVTAGGLVFVADRQGVVRALDADGKQIWKAYTGGPIYYAPVVANDRVFVGSADGRVYAYAARDGRFLWSFRVGPSDYWIPIYDRLISAWPVAGGVVVEGDTLYAAAGITHYDGTHVVALDTRTGQLKVSNSTSGTLEEEVNNGISMQGNLTIVDGELRFLAGGVYETARYDLKTLECLNTPRAQVNSQYRTAFYPYYPAYGKYVSLDYQCSDGCMLTHDASYEGSKFENLTRFTPLPTGTPKPIKEAARWVRRGGKMPESIWRDKGDRRFTSFVATDQSLMATGHPNGDEDSPFLVSIDTADGTDRWIANLPSIAVKGGTSIDHNGRILVTLENGQLLCFDPVR